LNIEKLNLIDLAYFALSQQTEIKNLLWDFKSVFDDKPGICKFATYSIKLEKKFQPKFQRAYRIPDRLKSEVDSQINELLKDAKIRPSCSPYAHPIVLVYKPDKNIRICNDYRSVNSGTETDRYPMARSDDILRKMARSKYITTLDRT